MKDLILIFVTSIVHYINDVTMYAVCFLERQQQKFLEI